MTAPENLSEKQKRDLVARNKAAGDILAILHSFGWKYLEARTKRQRERSCWISPEGKWYNVPFADHGIFALHVCKELCPNEIDHYGDNASSILLKREWLFIHHDWADGTIIRGYARMNERQYKVLLEFFGDERLFRGWIVRTMWLAKEDMREQSKDD